MATEVIMPKMGQTVEEVTIVRWLVEEGATVEKGQPLAEIETDKAVFELEAPAAGVLRGVRYGKGAAVPVLEVLAVIAAPGEAVETPAAQRPSIPGVSEGAAAPAAVPPAVQSATARLPQGQVFASPRARRLAHLEGVDLSQVAPTGGGGVRVAERDVRAYLEARPRVTPVARRMAEATGLDLRGVAGTGAVGRILKEDVARAVVAPPVPGADEGLAPAVREVVPIGGVRQIIAERMLASTQTTAAVTLTTEVDASELVNWRESFKADGFKVAYNDLLIKIVARALGEHPYLNAAISGEEIHLLESINVGLAVDAERGLLVPVIRNADRKGLLEIAAESAALAERARAGKILPDELTGGTFTITNLGMYEIDAFTPLINLPECAVLGVGRIAEVAAVHEGQICIRKRMALSLTFDHRLVDGAPAARFLQRVKQLVEKPHLLLS
jgi:pyruvate dehydrogenase E2 component (dihydrolipoamide acetyltransferase)